MNVTQNIMKGYHPHIAYYCLAWKSISLDKKQLGLVNKNWKIVEHVNMKEMVVTFGNQENI